MIGSAHNLSPNLEDHIGDVDKYLQLEALAREILELARSSLLVHLRFMDKALLQMPPCGSTFTKELASDGRYVHFFPMYVLRCYQQSSETVARNYLHTVLHCVFRHPFIDPQAISAPLWDLSCDIAVESLINDLALPCTNTLRQSQQAHILARLREEVDLLSAEKLYRYFRQQPPEAALDYGRLRELFHADDHSLWYEEAQSGTSDGDRSDGQDTSGEEAGAPLPASGSSEEEETSPPPDGEGTPADEASAQARSGQGEDGIGTGNGPQDDSPQTPPLPTPSKEELSDLWKQISERMQVDLDTASHSWGEGSGDLTQQLRALNRERYDYAAFLRRFSDLGETIQVNHDEFDYILYTYGLTLFGNIPLVEPLEYQEVKRIREFVIALDTSQSVSGELVQCFVNKTYNILKQRENFFTKINLHIIQCGASVQEDRKITSQEEFDEYIAHMQLLGFGGTDFRPVFTHVDELIRTHEFSNLKGLIYFTDGYGTFPAMPPSYDAAFVFCTDRTDTPDVPPWAIKLILTPEEVSLL